MNYIIVNTGGKHSLHSGMTNIWLPTVASYTDWLMKGFSVFPCGCDLGLLALLYLLPYVACQYLLTGSHFVACKNLWLGGWQTNYMLLGISCFTQITFVFILFKDSLVIFIICAVLERSAVIIAGMRLSLEQWHIFSPGCTLENTLLIRSLV